jgi:hypothetical protein
MQIATSTRILIQKRNKLQEQWQRTHDITFRPLTNSLKEHTDLAIKEQLLNTWQKTLRSLEANNMKDTWRMAKSLTNANPNIPSHTINGETAATTQKN